MYPAGTPSALNLPPTVEIVIATESPVGTQVVKFLCVKVNVAVVANAVPVATKNPPTINAMAAIKTDIPLRKRRKLSPTRERERNSYIKYFSCFLLIFNINFLPIFILACFSQIFTAILVATNIIIHTITTANFMSTIFLNTKIIQKHRLSTIYYHLIPFFIGFGNL